MFSDCLPSDSQGPVDSDGLPQEFKAEDHAVILHSSGMCHSAEPMSHVYYFPMKARQTTRSPSIGVISVLSVGVPLSVRYLFANYSGFQHSESSQGYGDIDVAGAVVGFHAIPMFHAFGTASFIVAVSVVNKYSLSCKFSHPIRRALGGYYPPSH